jgi:hypothetical protein
MELNNTIATPHPDVQSSLLDEEAVLLNLSSGYYHSLNPLGTKIWTLCDGTRSLQDVLASICFHYDVPEETAKHDLIQLVTQLTQEGLVELHSEPEVTN